MVEFLAERFNYAIVIVLMMTGLYIVFSTGNLVKKLVGLSVFQTSVFLLYISVGKVAGGRPPILDLGHGEDTAGHAAADGHEAEAQHAPAAAAPAQAATETPPAADAEAEVEVQPDGETPPATDPGEDAEAPSETAAAPAEPDADAPPESAAEGDPEGLAPNDPDIEVDPELPEPGAPEVPDAAAQTPPPEALPAAGVQPDAAQAPDAGAGALDAAHGALDTVYSNPLPHVLILTAIVVGVATLAVGLALVVRIRETYGVIEEDELHRADLDLAPESRA